MIPSKLQQRPLQSVIPRRERLLSPWASWAASRSRSDGTTKSEEPGQDARISTCAERALKMAMRPPAKMGVVGKQYPPGIIGIALRVKSSPTRLARPTTRSIRYSMSARAP